MAARKARTAPPSAVVVPGDTPGLATETPAQRQASVARASRTHADRQAEYVSAGGPYWYANALSSLPHPIDDVTLEFGDDLYARMLHDAQLSSLVNVFKTGVLEDGVTFSAAVAEGDPDHAAATELAEWCAWVFGTLDTAVDEALWDMMDAVPFGNRVAELVYRHAPGPDGTEQLLLKKIATKPRRMTAFVVDAFNNLVGLLGAIPGEAFYVQAGQLVDPATMPNFIDREKFAVLTFRAQNNDPRGRSICREAYDPWYVKQQIKVEYLKYIAQFSVPFLIGYTGPDADDEPVYDPATGLEVPGDSPETIMAQRLSTAANSRALAFSNGSKVDMHQVKGEGQAHMLGIDLQNREMAKAILNQTLATEEGKHQTRASSGTHQDILDTIIRQAKRAVERMIVSDMLTTLITVNFGAAALALMPHVTLGRAEQHDFSAMATAIAALATAGYLDASQLAEIDLMLGLPVRDSDDDAIGPDAGAQAGPADDQPGGDRPGGDSTPGEPEEPERHAAAVIGLAARAAHLRRARVRAVAVAAKPAHRWDGATLRTWVREVA